MAVDRPAAGFQFVSIAATRILTAAQRSRSTLSQDVSMDKWSVLAIQEQTR